MKQIDKKRPSLPAHCRDAKNHSAKRASHGLRVIFTSLLFADIVLILSTQYATLLTFFTFNLFRGLCKLQFEKEKSEFGDLEVAVLTIYCIKGFMHIKLCNYISSMHGWIFETKALNNQMFARGRL
jgi:hypothetical protein